MIKHGWFSLFKYNINDIMCILLYSVECTDSSNSATVPAGTYCSENDQACCVAHGGRIRSASSEPKRIRKAQIFSERKRFWSMRFLKYFEYFWSMKLYCVFLGSASPARCPASTPFMCHNTMDCADSQAGLETTLGCRCNWEASQAV